MDSSIAKLKKELREALAEYMWTEGCTCCRDSDGHEQNAERLGKLLGVRKYADKSGYDFDRYRSSKTRKII